MSDQPQTQPRVSKPRKPRVFHWVRRDSVVALCGEPIPPKTTRVRDKAAQAGRVVCPACEDFRRWEKQLDS